MPLPHWLKKRKADRAQIHELKKGLRAMGLHTVCEEARCPNLGECFCAGTATFMIMGKICTRSCSFCAVTHGKPKVLDPDEPQKLALQAAKLKLKHIVITSVTRDDLSDGGASHFALTIKAIRSSLSQATIEVLTPDFGGEAKHLWTVLEANPQIFNHNLETVVRLTPKMRDQAQYSRSLKLLSQATNYANRQGMDLKIKSGFMVGLGESSEEVEATIRDLRNAGCSIITIGQYLRPSREAYPVKEYIEPSKFKEYKEFGEQIGVEKMFCGPLVRSSYKAGSNYAIDY